MNGNIRRKTIGAVVVLLALTGAVVAPVAEAGPYGRHWASAYHFHYDPVGWRGGRWVHSWHGGRYGWWWLVGASWLLYPDAVYPYPDPSVEPTYVITDAAAQPMTAAPVTAPPPAQVWYYCDNPQGYYPSVPACPSGWRAVPATPPDLH